MAKSSIGETSLALTASADKFVAEFRRADNESRRSATAIDKEVDKLTKGLKRKFGLADFGKDMLRGFGIGSGFAVAQQAAELIVGYYERAAKAAQDMEESTARQLGNTLELIKLHQTDEQQLAALNKEFNAAARTMEEMQKPKVSSIPGHWGKADRGPRMWIPARTESRGRNDEEQAALNTQIDLVGKLGFERDKLTEKVRKAGTEALISNAKVSEGLNKYQKDYEGAEEAIARGTAEAEKWNEEMNKAAAGFRELIDPSLKFTEQMAEVNFLLEHGKLSADEAADAIARLQAAMTEDKAGRVDKALKDFFGPLDDMQKEIDRDAKEASKTAIDMGFAFQSAFEDAILEGEKFSDVLKGLAQDILRIAIRSAITQPIGNWIGGMFSGMFGGGKASGGPVSKGTSYLVGEQGPEMFTPRTAGSITPNHALAGGGSGGDKTYYIDARGADRTGLAQLLSYIRQVDGSIEERSVAANFAAGRRTLARA